MQPTACLPLEEVSCGDGECLPIHLRCDGTPDCWTAKDEEGCSPNEKTYKVTD